MQSPIPPAPGSSVILGDFGTFFKVTSETTGGAYAIIEHTLAPGVLGAPLHRHSREDELSYILEGELTAQLGNRIITAPVGTYVHKPRGDFHTFWNESAIPVRFIEIISPGEFVYYFPELGKIMASRDAPSEVQQEKLAALRERFGLEMDMSSIPRLLATHNVRLR